MPYVIEDGDILECHKSKLIRKTHYIDPNRDSLEILFYSDSIFTENFEYDGDDLPALTIHGTVKLINEFDEMNLNFKETLGKGIGTVEYIETMGKDTVAKQVLDSIKQVGESEFVFVHPRFS